MEVKGIGQKTFDDIKDRITVGVETKKKIDDCPRFIRGGCPGGVPPSPSPCL